MSDSRQRLLVALGLLSQVAVAGGWAAAMGGVVAANLAARVSLAGAAVGLGAGLVVRGRMWTSALVIPSLCYLVVVLTS